VLPRNALDKLTYLLT